jgi:hypothetical protein
MSLDRVTGGGYKSDSDSDEEYNEEFDLSPTADDNQYSHILDGTIYDSSDDEYQPQSIKFKQQTAPKVPDDEFSDADSMMEELRAQREEERSDDDDDNK